MPSHPLEYRAAALANFQRKYAAFLAAAEKLHRIVAVEAGASAIHPRIRSIMELVAKEYQIPMQSLVSIVRTAELVEPRHIAIWLCLRLTNLSTVRVGYAFARDHSAVMHARKAVDKRRETDFRYRVRLEILEARASAAVAAA